MNKAEAINRYSNLPILKCRGTITIYDYPLQSEIILKTITDAQKRLNRSITVGEIYYISLEAKNRMFELDTIAREDIWDVSKKVAASPTLFFNPSKPGLYHWTRKRQSPDPYHDEPFAPGIERVSADVTARLIALFSTRGWGYTFDGLAELNMLGFNPKLNVHADLIQQFIMESPHRILYMGNHEETENMQHVFMKRNRGNNSTFVPQNVVDMVEPSRITNTVDQIKVLGNELRSQEYAHFKQIVIVATAPQAVRMAYICKKYNAIPNNMDVYIFPLPTPNNGLKIYPRNEIAGIHIRRLRDEAADTPISYKTPRDWRE